jgi:two-component sensor histidine kinase
LSTAGHGHTSSIDAHLELALAPTSVAPTRARAAVSSWLARQHRSTLPVDLALLLVSELVTNSIRHALIGADDELRLTGRLSSTGIRLAVWDGGTAGVVGPRHRRGDDDTGGFGLGLVAQLASAWGVERDTRGTTVWLELAAVPGRG